MVSLKDLAILPNSNVLLLWSSQCSPEDVKSTAESLSQYKLQLENMERLQMANHDNSTFDAVLCGVVSPSMSHSESLLAEVLRLLKPSGRIILVDSVQAGVDPGSVLAKLKLTGFVDGTQASNIQLENGSNENGTTDRVFEFSASKPNYEVGSSSQLKISFSKKSSSQNVSKAAAQVWSLDSAEMLDDDLELIDDSDLLNEDDLKKPDPSSLLAPCGPGSGRKKACKNCVCGLADELDEQSTGVKLKSKTVTSACGSCYLGDAFRCSSCPYLGMPAFKSGEKIQLTDRQLNADK